MKIGVLFNCQHKGIAASLRALLPGDEVVSYGIPELTIGRQKYADRAEADLRGCAMIVCLDDRIRRTPMPLSEVRTWGPKLILLPAVVFGGFHPDACYTVSGAKPLMGPTQAIHSRIAAAAYLGGLDADDTVPLFNRLVFQRLAYFEVFAAQRYLLSERFARYGIDLAPWFARWMETGCFMYSMNHPKVCVLLDVARMACELAGLPQAAVADMPEDDLAKMPSHPVYPDLAAVIGMQPEQVIFHLRHAPKKPPVFADLHQYITLSFETYDQTPRGVLMEIDGVGDALRALDLVA